MYERVCGVLHMFVSLLVMFAEDRAGLVWCLCGACAVPVRCLCGACAVPEWCSIHTAPEPDPFMHAHTRLVTRMCAHNLMGAMPGAVVWKRPLSPKHAPSPPPPQPLRPLAGSMPWSWCSRCGACAGHEPRICAPCARTALPAPCRLRGRAGRRARCLHGCCPRTAQRG